MKKAFKDGAYVFTDMQTGLVASFEPHGGDISFGKETDVRTLKGARVTPSPETLVELERDARAVSEWVPDGTNTCGDTVYKNPVA